MANSRWLSSHCARSSLNFTLATNSNFIMLANTTCNEWRGEGARNGIIVLIEKDAYCSIRIDHPTSTTVSHLNDAKYKKASSMRVGYCHCCPHRSVIILKHTIHHLSLVKRLGTQTCNLQI